MSYFLGATSLSPAQQLQSDMAKYGFYKGAIDGLLGPASLAAAKKWAAAAANMLLQWQIKGDLQVQTVQLVSQLQQKITAASSFSALDGIMKTAFKQYVLVAAEAGSRVPEASRAFMTRPLNITSDTKPRPAAPPPEPEPVPLPLGTSNIPGIGPVPMVLALGAVAVLGFILIKK